LRQQPPGSTEAEFLQVVTIQNSNTHTAGQVALSILGWTAAPDDAWEIVKEALEDVGATDARRAPIKSLTFTPRLLRQGSAAK